MKIRRIAPVFMGLAALGVVGPKSCSWNDQASASTAVDPTEQCATVGEEVLHYQSQDGAFQTTPGMIVKTKIDGQGWHGAKWSSSSSAVGTTFVTLDPKGKVTTTAHAYEAPGSKTIDVLVICGSSEASSEVAGQGWHGGNTSGQGWH